MINAHLNVFVLIPNTSRCYMPHFEIWWGMVCRSTFFRHFVNTRLRKCISGFIKCNFFHLLFYIEIHIASTITCDSFIFRAIYRPPLIKESLGVLQSVHIFREHPVNWSEGISKQHYWCNCKNSHGETSDTGRVFIICWSVHFGTYFCIYPKRELV